MIFGANIPCFETSSVSEDLRRLLGIKLLFQAHAYISVSIEIGSFITQLFHVSDLLW